MGGCSYGVRQPVLLDVREEKMDARFIVVSGQNAFQDGKGPLGLSPAEEDDRPEKEGGGIVLSRSVSFCRF